MSLFLQGTFLLLDLLKKSNSTKKQITICFSSHYNRSPNTKSLDLKYLEAIEEMLNFASVTNVLQKIEIAISYLLSVVCSDAQLCRTDFQPTVGTNSNGL